jgi:16S rRNA C1402 (ribose-2'-O) methylase RsmI
LWLEWLVQNIARRKNSIIFYDASHKVRNLITPLNNMAPTKKTDSSVTAVPLAKVGRPTVYNTVEDVVKMVRNSCLAGIAKFDMVE